MGSLLCLERKFGGGITWTGDATGVWLEVDRPTQFSQSFFNVGERVCERSATVRAGSSLGEDALSLQLEGLYLPFAVSFCCSQIGCGLSRPCGQGLLLFHGLALRSLRHRYILLRRFGRRYFATELPAPTSL